MRGMGNEYIVLAHGAGGRESEQLIKQIFNIVRLRKVNNGIGLDEFDDGALIPLRTNFVVSMDSYTVDPIFFPGGDIGKLAAAGSINDVAVMGAEPFAALDSIVVEEGFPIRDLRKVINSMVKVFEFENVALISGDFKVMPREKVDKIIITTVVLGRLDNPSQIFLDSNVKPGDKIIVTGPVGDHGAVITALRMGIEAEIGELKSDCQPVTPIMRIAKHVGGVHAAKDPTRGGLAMALNEFAGKSNVAIFIDEDLIPIREEVRALSDMLGIDPLALACEGRVVLSVDPNYADDLLSSLRKNGFSEATIVGEAKDDHEWNGFVILKTEAGGLRILEKPTGELTPRIC